VTGEDGEVEGAQLVAVANPAVDDEPRMPRCCAATARISPQCP
jgi:hypothetical protein